MTGSLSWNETSLTKSISAEETAVWQLEKQLLTLELTHTDITSDNERDGKTPSKP